MNGTVESAAWLASDILLLAANGENIENEALETSATAGEVALEVATRTLHLGSNGTDSGSRLLVVSCFGAPLQTQNALSLEVGSGDSVMTVDAEQLAASMTDPATLLRDELSTLAPERRTEALDLIWTAAGPRLDRRGSFLLSRLLAKVNKELRPPLPPMTMTRDEPNVAHIDVAFEINPRTLWVEGWLRDRDGTTARLTLVAPEGGRAQLLPKLFRFRRRDIDEYYGDKQGVRGERHGIINCVQLDGPSYLSSGWLLELETDNGWTVQKAVPDISRDLIDARERILVSLQRERPGSDELKREHTQPAISGIQDVLRKAVGIETVVQLGEPPNSPSVSVIVPLYKQLSFLEYQMAHWSRDPEMPQEDLIYVLDSEEQADMLDRQARGLHSLYGIPFRIAIMKGNAGFAGVNNCAAGIARAKKLLLLNSDVVPDSPGWLARMSAFYDGTPNIGALGPKLLYEDDSLQHAGMYFYRSPENQLWANMHYFKGQHRQLPQANVVRQVPAVTGACLMVERDLYEGIGGLSHQYVQGGYEDSDFCIRLIEKGHENWYLPGAELYHLEDQSYPTEVRKRVTAYNMWLHTELWGEKIEQLMEQHPGPEG